MRLQKVASAERLFLVVAYTLTGVVSFRYLSCTKLVTGTPKKGPKMVFVEGLLMCFEGLLGLVLEMMDN